MFVRVGPAHMFWSEVSKARSPSLTAPLCPVKGNKRMLVDGVSMQPEKDAGRWSEHAARWPCCSVRRHTSR